MLNRILIVLTTVVVCLAGTLLYDRLLPFTYPASVTTAMLLMHYASKSIFGIILAYLVRKKYHFLRYLGYALLASIVGGLVDALIGFPVPKELPAGSGLHDFILTMASFILYMILSRSSTPAQQEG